MHLPVQPILPGETERLPAAATTARAGRGASASLRGGISLGTPFGVPVRATVSGLLVALLLAYGTLGTAARAAGYGGQQQAGLAVLGALLLQSSVLAHEIAHCVAARRLGLAVTGLKLWALGGLTEVEAETSSPRREYAVAIVGPLASLFLGGCASAAALLSGAGRDGAPLGSAGEGLLALVLAWLALVNVALAAFNLLPGLPLDGGRVLRAAVWSATGREATATRVAAVTGFVVAGATVLTALLLPSGGQGSGQSGFSSAVLALLVGAYLGTSAAAALRRARLSERAPGLSAGRLARRATTATADLPLAEALRRAGLVGATSVVVTTRDGTPAAIVSGAQVDATPAERRPWVSVSSVARPITEGLVLDARLSGQSVLDALRTHPASEYLVVAPAPDRLSHLVGVLATVDVVAAVDPRRLRPAWAR